MSETMSTDDAQMEMPRYKSHKVVHALKIGNLRAENGELVMDPIESRYAPIILTGDYVTKHDPQVGGYYVVYPDGYKSFSPAQAFEAGYTRIGVLKPGGR